MIKEDGCLFPQIRRLEERRVRGNAPVHDATEVRTQIRFARAEQTRTLRLLSQIQRLIQECLDHQAPDGAPITALFDLIYQDVRRHFHLEDEVLFPMVERWCSPNSGDRIPQR